MSEKTLAQKLGQASASLAKEARDVLAGFKPERRDVGTGETRFVPPPSQVTSDEESLDGWGFKDTRFVVKPDGNVVLTGSRYNISNVELPSLMPWFSKMLASPLGYDNRNEPHYPPVVPEPKQAPALLTALREFLAEDQLSSDPLVRLRRGHGHTGAEIWAIRYERLERVPDLVVFPASHEQVVQLTDAAKQHGACLIPFGGGTNVTDALRLSVDEQRFVIAVDMRRMNHILWIDPVNRMACIEAGATGRHLVAELAKHGFTMGHEPDSVEFSTLGGWIATNASGMKKNRYGNIEDLVLDMKVVTAHGVVERPRVGPRESIGPNPKNFMFGSEGNYGIVTSAVVKLFPLPEVQRYGSVLFPDLAAGLAFLYDLQSAGAVPASVRVMDNTQFHFGQALKPKKDGLGDKLKSDVEKFFVTQVKGYDPDTLAVATLVFEGTEAEVEFQERILYPIAERHGGMKAGGANGERGYQLTFGIAYIRDLTFEHWAIAESFETSVPWSRAMELYERVRERVSREHERRKLPGKPFFTGRITQVYPTGVCIYFYMGFYAKGVEDPVREYTEMEHAAREEMLAAGGSLSHHHGVGKLRQRFMKDIYSEGARTFTREVKKAVDPDNLFGASNHGVLGQVELEREPGSES
ncbi:glycolate oxidase, subunit GlcD, putative [Myxococcus hansupus]|uniref:Glycolate oxidase, subunit GlcD, putative n=1 Tax=Pseudomyxococcus hansupus TaxID=1297742 RepID=A0A0H4X7L4_9BACT|nr:FAD-binding oxidoreductase [Myxococcus hansupus]AKQ69928.1 glycolate oxidase, subunit GlcD, putative [Myxococcus hansupus]